MDAITILLTIIVCMLLACALAIVWIAHRAARDLEATTPLKAAAPGELPPMPYPGQDSSTRPRTLLAQQLKAAINGRFAGFLALPLIVMIWLVSTDPDGGKSTLMLVMAIAVSMLAIVVAYFGAKWLAPYISGESAWREAIKSPVGAGLALIARALIVAALLGLVGKAVHAAPVATPKPSASHTTAGRAPALSVRTHIPPGAMQYAPMLAEEMRKHWPDHPLPSILAALVEHESCISLKHSRCWNPRSQLKTQREEGAGLGQITRAYRKDGSVRFDSLSDMRNKHAALREWSWGNVYDRPDLQLRAVVLMSRDNHVKISKLVSSAPSALLMTDAAYNGGLGGLMMDRRMCHITEGCNPSVWTRNVERTCSKSKQAIYGARNPCDINRHHVTDVVKREAKYRQIMTAPAPRSAPALKAAA